MQVAITGMGLVSAIGNNVAVFRKNLLSGQSGIGEIKAFDASQFRSQFGAEVTGIDFRSYVTKAELKHTDRLSLLGIVAAEEAIADAGLELHRDSSELGVSMGTGLGPSSSIEESVVRASKGQRLRPTTILKIMLNSPGATLCERYQCREVSNVHVTACSASAHAIAQAADFIRRGELDLCLAGGSDAFPSGALFAAWDALEVMTPSEGEPAKAMRPFSADRSGFAIGEGAAVLVLESMARARKRGAKVIAEIAGTGSGSHAPNLTKPSVDGMEFAMRRALKNSKVARSDIGYVNAHGTATELNDILETQALHHVFGNRAAQLRVSSTKAAHGHTMGASGAIEAVATILALNGGIAPPTLNLDEPDPACDLDYTPNTARDLNCRAALSNSFAFGGHCVSLVLVKGD